MSLREEQCNKVCRILDDVLANRPTERDSLIVATRSAFSALPPAQPEQCEDAVSRKDALDEIQRFIGYIDQDMINRIHIGLKRLPSVTPKQRTGKWILDRSGAYCCSECMEPCAGYVMMKPRDKFCKMCGSRNEVTE